MNLPTIRIKFDRKKKVASTLKGDGVRESSRMGRETDNKAS